MDADNKKDSMTARGAATLAAANSETLTLGMATMHSKSDHGRILTYFFSALLVVTTGWMAGVGSAAMILGPAVPLSNYVNNQPGELVVGDKKFTTFTYSATGDMPAAGGVNVIPIKDDLGNFGIRFQGAFVDVPSSQGGSDALITYMVETTDPARLISDAHLEGNPSLLGNFGSISVTETFLPLGMNGEYTMKIFDDESLPTPVLVDWVDFLPPVKKLNVQKDILAIATQNSQTATMSFVDQTFSQIVIPEPATLLLLVSGCMGIAVVSRRKML
jgi:hypothetical protein